MTKPAYAGLENFMIKHYTELKGWFVPEYEGRGAAIMSLQSGIQAIPCFDTIEKLVEFMRPWKMPYVGILSVDAPEEFLLKAVSNGICIYINPTSRNDLTIDCQWMIGGTGLPAINARSGATEGPAN